MSYQWVRTALAAAALAAMASGCAEEREPINRVQANALAKSFFVGADLAGTADDPEFYTQATLVDVGYGASQDGLFTSTYTEGVARIKWQITEDLLIGRLSYERIADSDHKGAGAASTDGQVVVAYKILGHFDIRHAYNPSTGEELNVIEENSSDRPWYQREYFRVDWSQNLNTDAYEFDTLSLLGIYGGVSYTSLAYYVSDPADEDAPYFDVDTGYFDVTNKAFATPGMLDLSHLGWGIDAYPACYLPNDILGGTWPVGNCNAVEITIRQAFRKVTDTDYEPADWDGWRFQAYGAFYTERLGYARNYGMTDDNWHRMIDRYNIWERSHFYGADCKDGGEGKSCQDKRADAMAEPVECYKPYECDAAVPTFADPGQEYDWRLEHCRGTPYGEDAHRDLNNDGTDDECELVTKRTGVAGSRCDTFKQRCTLPYRLRTPKPVAWYFTSHSNQEYFAGTEWATHEHDVAMRHAIQVARYAECRSTGGSKPDCAAAHPVYFGQMDEHLDALQLAQEVDDCRHGLSHADYGTINSKARESKCVALADSVAMDRDLADFNGAPNGGLVALAKMPEQIVLCHSPVEKNDAAACAPSAARLPASLTAVDCEQAYKEHDAATLASCRQARFVRRGDLRYHQVNVLEAPQTPSPWGIYLDSHDPLSGETFSASINVWSHVNDLWSQLVMDRIRYIKGELSTEEVTEGEYVRDWAQAAEAASGGQGVAGKLSREQIDHRVADFTHVDAAALKSFNKKLDPAAYEQIKALHNQIKDVRAMAGAPSSMRPIYEARRKAAAGTEFEAELVDPMMQQYAGVSELPTGAAMEYASILRRLNPSVQKQLRQTFENGLAHRGGCMLREAPAPMAITGLAGVLEQKFGKFDPTQPKTEQQARAERMRRYLAQRAQYAVIVHEMGHSVGMRHNFVSSSDAYSYRPQYWQLRTNNGEIKTRCGCVGTESYDDPSCMNYVEDGSSCVGPRYFDPATAYEQDNLIWMWMHSSTMDYAGEYTQDLVGLGAWDFAAHGMFYGENVPVYDGATFAVGQERASGLLSKMDNFGGIIGIQPEYAGNNIHYSQLNNHYELITKCAVVDETKYRPASWDENAQGIWHPVVDGYIVPSTQGQYTKCRQPPVDYLPWQRLHFPAGNELTDVSYYRGGPSISNPLPINTEANPDTLDRDGGRIRVPYGFATDSWADVGNASVYRHDNGADTYEIFDFLITQQEVQHIFDAYRRHRNSFSVRSAAERILTRYNEKIRDGAKGLGLLANIYRDFADTNGWVFEGGYWAFIANLFYRESILASSMTFDHFVRTMARPEAGGHYRDKASVLRSEEDTYANNTIREVLIPNGATGYFGQIGVGGKLIENRLSENHGEYDRDYTINAGSYYDKVYAPYLMTESEDNFISDSRSDFVDGRYRAVSLADLFPDGFRRWMGNNLTGDDFLKGPRLAASATGKVLLDDQKYPSWPIGWVSWWTETPEVCFPATGTVLCSSFGGDNEVFDPRQPEGVAVLDPQVNWEQQKFLIAMTLLYLPSNQKEYWINQLRLWQLGPEADPGFQNRIEFHDPYGKVYVAKSFGTETQFGKVVQKGIAARVLEYANQLLAKGYETTPIDWDENGQIDWYEPVMNPETGTPNVKWDSSMMFIDPSTGQFVGSLPDCNKDDNSGCPCSANSACKLLGDYVSVPFYLWEAFYAYRLLEPDDMKGIYE